MVLWEKHGFCFPEYRHIWGAWVCDAFRTCCTLSDTRDLLRTYPNPFVLLSKYFQSNMALCWIITHILLLVQCFHIMKYVIRGFGGTDQKCLGDVMLLFKVTPHDYAGIWFSTTPGATEHKQGWQLGICRTCFDGVLGLHILQLVQPLLVSWGESYSPSL